MEEITEPILLDSTGKEIVDKLTNIAQAIGFDCLNTKVDKTTTINGHALDDNITITKSDIGLSNVDNTSDTNKPVSIATQTELNKKVDKVPGYSLSKNDFTDALKNKLNGIAEGALVNSITGVKGNAEGSYRTGNINITPANIGLGNVNNTSDPDKPVSTAQQTALDGKVDKVVGKGLSTEDFTSTYKTTLDNLSINYAPLIDGLVPAANLPSYVDDVIEVASKTKFPTTGESGKIYVALDTDLTYRWGGTEYVEISKSLALGETASTAYAGDKGAANATAITTHTENTNNPHSVTKVQVGLGNVDNTSDLNKPVSTATQTELNKKVDKIEGKGLSTEDYTSADKTKLAGIASGAQVNSITGVKGEAEENYRTGNVSISAANIGLGNVDNTADKDKEVKLADNVKGSNKPNLVLVSNGDGTTSWVDFNSINLLAYGIKWNTEVASPICTRVGNMLLHLELPIQSKFRGCIVKDGIFLYYLDPNDWSKKKDGTPSKLDGIDGDVMVHTPKFYGRSFIDGTDRYVYISTIKIDNTWIEIPEMYISAYRSTVDNITNKIASVCSTEAKYRGGDNRSANDTYLTTDIFRTDLGKPRTNISRATMRTYARNAGLNILSYEAYKWIFYWCYVIEYANFNCQDTYSALLTDAGFRQGGLGAGVTNINNDYWNYYNGRYPLTPCGYTNEFGNFTGVKELTTTLPTSAGADPTSSWTTYVPRWRGFENPFGDIWTNLDGVIIQGYADEDGEYRFKNVYSSKDTTQFADSLNSSYEKRGLENYLDGHYKTFDLLETAEIIPNSTGGSATTYKCDYHYVGDKNTSLRTLLVGGNAIHGSSAGFGYFHSYAGVGYSAANFGFRSFIQL